MDNLTPRGFIVGLEKPDDDVGPNRPLESLFYNYLAGRLRFESYDFRDGVIKTVLQAFGTDDFTRWFLRQSLSPYYTEKHLEFLRDMLRYMEGQETRYDTDVWDCLITRGGTIPFTPVEDQDAIELQFFGISTDNRQRDYRPFYVSDLIERYAEREGGLQKLLYTCVILFGDNYKELEQDRTEHFD